MSRTYRRRGQRHDYDRVLRDYDWVNGVLIQLWIDACSKEGRHALALQLEAKLFGARGRIPQRLQRSARHYNPMPGTHKIDNALRAISGVDPSIEVLRSREAFEALHPVHSIFGCFDNDGAPIHRRPVTSARRLQEQVLTRVLSDTLQAA